MSQNDVSPLMFDENEVKTVRSPLPRLLRVIFYGLGITSEGYYERYLEFWKNVVGDSEPKRFRTKAGSDRNFLRDKNKLTFSMFHHALNAMGYEIKAISIRIEDNHTGEQMTFSTDDTVDSLNEMIMSKRKTGLDSL